MTSETPTFLTNDLAVDPLPGAALLAFTNRLQNEFQIQFRDPQTLSCALTHKSYRNENRRYVPEDNERFEFLGDAILGLVLSDILMRRFPDQPEGVLSKRRASLVNEETLSEIARQLKLDTVVRLGKGEHNSGGAQKPRLLASTLEALFASVFRDSGFERVQNFIEKLYESRLDAFTDSSLFPKDYKTRLQELVQSLGRPVPIYRVITSEGPEHEKNFSVEVVSDDRLLGEGRGRSKKQAEQEAARVALDKIETSELKLQLLFGTKESI